AARRRAVWQRFALGPVAAPVALLTQGQPGGAEQTQAAARQELPPRPHDSVSFVAPRCRGAETVFLDQFQVAALVVLLRLRAGHLLADGRRQVAPAVRGIRLLLRLRLAAAGAVASLAALAGLTTLPALVLLTLAGLPLADALLLAAVALLPVPG